MTSPANIYISYFLQRHVIIIILGGWMGILITLRSIMPMITTNQTVLGLISTILKKWFRFIKDL
jgi:hypothetical protein